MNRNESGSKTNAGKTGAIRMPYVRLIMIAVLLALLSTGLFLSCAAAEVNGTTGAAVTFYAEAYTENAYVELNSYQGEASVDNYSWTNDYKKTVTEEHYGFYEVTVTGSGYSKTYYWTPSKTVGQNPHYIESRTLQVSLPKAGKYTVRVEPFSKSQIDNCWYTDQFNYWTRNAYWDVNREINCSVSSVSDSPKPNFVTVECYTHDLQYLYGETRTVYQSETIYPPEIGGYFCDTQEQYYNYQKSGGSGTVKFYYVYVEGSVTIYCIDENGQCFDSYKEKVYESRYVNPRDYDGYKTLSGSQYVTIDPSYSSCKPGSFDFYYKHDVVPPTLHPASQVVRPYGWDTQFKPGTSAPDRYNEKRVNRLGNICDDNYATSFDWLIWSAERTDDIPELTAYFNGDTISSIQIRNGYLKNSSEYSQYARATSLRLTIYSGNGQRYDTRISIPDEYTTSYRTFSLGGTYSNVTRVDIWLDGFKCNDSADSDHKYVIHIADIQFGS